MKSCCLTVLLTWILWSQFIGKLEISWILLDRFDTKLECEEARDERAARLVKQNAFDGQYVLTCYPDTFDPRKVITKTPPPKS
jgi:hypothetical protein